MPQAFTATSTSSGPGSGAGTSSNENFLYSLSNNAFIQVVGRGYTELAELYEKDLNLRLCHEASRGGFTRQPVNVACFEALTKVGPVRLPVRSRQLAVRSSMRGTLYAGDLLKECRFSL